MTKQKDVARDRVAAAETKTSRAAQQLAAAEEAKTQQVHANDAPRAKIPAGQASFAKDLAAREAAWLRKAEHDATFLRSAHVALEKKTQSSVPHAPAGPLLKQLPPLAPRPSACTLVGAKVSGAPREFYNLKNM